MHAPPREFHSLSAKKLSTGYFCSTTSISPGHALKKLLQSEPVITGLLGALVPSGCNDEELGFLLTKVTVSPSDDLILDENDLQKLKKEPEIQELPVTKGPTHARNRSDVIGALLNY